MGVGINSAGIGKSNMNSSGSDGGAGGIKGEDVLGVELFDTGTISLGSTTTSPTIPNAIVSYNGLGISALHGVLTVVDTPGGTTAPGTPTTVQSVIKLLSFQSINGGVGAPLIEVDGSLNEISNWQRILNPNGNYQTSAAPTIGTSTAVTTTYNFDFYYDIPATLFNLRPKLTFNTEASRATTLNGMTSTARLVLSADYTNTDVYGKPLYGSRLKNIPLNQSATGVAQIANGLDKSVSVIQQAYDFGIDSNLNASNTFNLSVQAKQIMNNMTYTNISGAEANIYPLGSHISGFFPFRPIDKQTRYFDNSLNLSVNLSSAPYVGGTGVNQVTDTIMAYLQEKL